MQEDAIGRRTVEIVDPWPASCCANESASLNRLPSSGELQRLDLRSSTCSSSGSDLNGRSRRIPWDSLISNFHALYCNWDPAMFDYRESVHA